MISFVNPAAYANDTARAMSGSPWDWPYLSEIMGRVPQRWHGRIADDYSTRYRETGQQVANRWIDKIAQSVTVRGASLAASDSEICNQAKACADTVRGILADGMDTLVGLPAGVVVLKLAAYCNEQGVEAPKGVELPGLISRLVDAAWWRRQFRRNAGRQVEAVARRMGMVQRRAGLYASDETCNRHAEQQRRNLAALENTEAYKTEIDTVTGEVTEQAFNLAELAELGISNPSVRFAELMVRVRGMEQHARANGHVGLFITGTAPGYMHAVHGKTGKQNRLFDETTPREAQQWIARQWSRVRAALARLKIKYYGVRVAEPHHDGTPHWHMLVFIRPELTPGRSAVGRLMAVFRRYLLRGDWAPSVTKKQVAANIRQSRQTWRECARWADAIVSAEYVEQRRKERADDARRLRACDFKLIDWARGSAAGYLVKYLAKNISGQRMGLDDEAGTEKPKAGTETASRVLAWASCWGVRQFQVVGGPPVGVWRELRRLKEKPEQLELFDAWEATGLKREIPGPLRIGEKRMREQVRSPDWGQYITAQGGIDIKRDERPVQLWKLQEPGRLTKYRDEAPARTAGVICKGVATGTRDAVWSIRSIPDEKRLEKSGAVGRGCMPSGSSKRRAAVALGFGSVLGAKRPRTRVNNCTQGTNGPWAGLAANMAGWEKTGNRPAVLEIFNEVRRLKGGRSSRESTQGMAGSAGTRPHDGGRLC